MMRKWMLMAAAFLVAGAGSAEILVSWDGNSTATPSNATLNISGQIFSVLPDGVETSRGSSDGWFGPDNTDDGGHAGADTTTAVGYKTSASGSPVAVRIYNHSEKDLDLATLVFDYKSIWDTGPQKLEVSYAYGDLAGMSNNTVLVTLDAPGFSGGAGAYDYPDFVVNLRSLLADYTLPPGGANATFNIQGVDASDGGVNGVVDNIAFLDTFPGVVRPDPVTVFEADFEGSAVTDATDGSLTASNLNAGTVGGSWTIDVDGGGSGNNAAVITTATAGGQALMLATDDYDAMAILSNAVSLEGTTVSLDAYLRNIANDAPVNRIIGLDSSDREVFEIILSGYDTSGDPSYRAVGFSDASGMNHYVGSNLLQVQQNSEYNPSKNRTLLLTLGAASMGISWDGAALTNGIAYKDAAATDLAEIRFMADSTTSVWEGMVYDNIEVLLIPPPLEGYDAWTPNVGLSGSPDADPDYDYDDDGWDNLMEYALDGNPKDGILGDNVPTTEIVGATLEYVHNVRADDPSLTYYLELTDNLVSGTWANMGYTVTGTNVTGGSYDQITNSIPTTESQTFIRLKVEN